MFSTAYFDRATLCHADGTLCLGQNWGFWGMRDQEGCGISELVRLFQVSTSTIRRA